MRPLLLLVSVACYAGAVVVQAPRQSLLETGRDLVRPALLPLLWAALESAQTEGTAEEYADRGRMLMKLVPQWTDGHIHVAGQLAFRASLAQEDKAVAVDRLLAGLALLDEARATNPTAEADEELVATKARWLFVRCSQDPALAAAFQARTGELSTQRVIAYMREVPRFQRSKHLQRQLFFIILGGLETDIRLREHRNRLVAAVDTALMLVDRVFGEDLATRWRVGLQKLRSFLLRTDDIIPDDIAALPLLSRIVDALRRN